MKFNQWTLALVAAGVVTAPSVVLADEAQHQVLTALSSTTLSGYVDTSAIWKFGTGNATLPGRSFDGIKKQDGFNLNVVKLQLDKPLDEAQWSAGYEAGLLFGPDANTLATSSSGVANSDFAVKDANVKLRVPVGNGLDIKMGVFTTPLGYEVFESGNNPNYSRSYGFAIEPITQTGVLASYKVNDMISLTGGVADPGINNQINNRFVGKGTETLKTYIGAVTLTAPESAGFLKGATLTAGINDAATAAGKDVLNYYVGGSLPTPIEGLALGAAYDYRANAVPGTKSSYENAVAAYLSYQASEKLKLSDRIEYATSTGGGLAGNNATGFVDSKGGNVAVFGNTLTVDYSLWANVISRAELRWDHSMTGQGQFGDGTDINALSVALNVIYKF